MKYNGITQIKLSIITSDNCQSNTTDSCQSLWLTAVNQTLQSKTIVHCRMPWLSCEEILYVFIFNSLIPNADRTCKSLRQLK